MFTSPFIDDFPHRFFAESPNGPGMASSRRASFEAAWPTFGIATCAAEPAVLGGWSRVDADHLLVSKWRVYAMELKNWWLNFWIYQVLDL